jgi:hypothetical protein
MTLTVCTHYRLGEAEKLAAILPRTKLQQVNSYPDHQEWLYGGVTTEQLATLRLQLREADLGRWWTTR